ncbi:3D-(3,5/4)-trihydroxycyclohexane-1,2-dione acylhydrolase (decyclizing) [Rhizobium leguminosarum bv. viciae]|uniref:3D-(3,5/4)-trihydroxycyclohexane-1,2-dione acylhydrolase (decyclizing) n=1 Tax=Rhizobium ruizarguesonis TaxID=2081791 RepID=UPI001030CC4E|nr:3D-(3,5/4)-trihydroxycyclohexane-1,2-dione acylhydrolase (decyclizing) [Rhizobium ruizarguesonis]TAT82300.1 3D-(3,5/4)-trihydroxycyclohexane-1,2-dione acylhydrolase (decyclizing) [Rhizobium ruizarguesonis]TAU29907.1 3D-(3,5/4)-trihydroxycyclohexane-1,2-dione acylhydrolase (decyclizing) [Rhizobium ruizarguesonis]TAW20055.1 3D-(3,5/4)-trihydroxycyclohexane-1,2-dione acylhydrolase (decyclizing) [Rhizobium ruizarguesonis]TBY49747.1 3D-(3,5/4)-trihydroxycyclohexane-1,2-dione acylhydrolase (decycl
MSRKTVRLTMAQALVRYLCNQFTEIDGERLPLFAGVFGIFGHGNVTCLSEALEAAQDQLPTWRGQNEQSMALAAVAFAKAKRRRQLMIAATSIGPGAANMVTAAGTAHTNRLPVLLIAGDTFANRIPDPVMQQVEHFNDPTVTVNDSFKPVTRYWDRIVLPEQIITSLPQAIAAMLDPADCGPAFIGLSQDTQEVAFDYPAAFFEPTVWSIPRPRADRRKLAEAVALLKSAKKPLIISGGGVRYSLAEEKVAEFAVKRGIPIVETIAGKGALTHNHPVHAGPIGIVGSTSANALAGEADVILAIGTRLQDFTTGSWTVFHQDAKFISINAARFDAVKHRALAVVGDALETVIEVDGALGDWKADPELLAKAQSLFADWNKLLDQHQAVTNGPIPTYAQVIGIVNETATPNDTLIAAAGGTPGEVTKGWRVKNPNTFDCEFGFSCMGYEIAAGWGHAMAKAGDGTPIVMIGDGTYMMMNSDIYSTVLSGHKMIVVVCDNGGYAVINRLQQFKGVPGFNNLIKDCRVKEPFAVDFVKHAESMGALARRCDSLADLKTAMEWAQTTDRTTIVTLVTDAYAWVPGDADWDVGVPEVSERESVQKARADQEKIRAKQRVGV